MTASLPRPYPGECLYSLLCRYHIRSGSPNPTQTSKAIFGRNYVQLWTTVLSPACLFTSAGRCFTDNKLATSLALEHTAFQYFSTSFFNFESIRTEKLLQGEILPSQSSWSHYLTSIKKSDAILRYCIECAREERAAYGEPYWHTLHQIKGVEYCPLHRIPLTKSDAVLNQIKKNEYYPAYIYARVDQTVTASVDEKFRKEFLELAEDINWLLFNGWSLGCSGQLSLKYMQNLWVQNKYEDIRKRTYKVMNVLNDKAIEKYAGSLPVSFLDMLGLYQSDWRVYMSPFYCHFCFTPLQHSLYMRGHFGSPKDFYLYCIESNTSAYWSRYADMLNGMTCY